MRQVAVRGSARRRINPVGAAGIGLWGFLGLVLTGDLGDLQAGWRQGGSWPPKAEAAELIWTPLQQGDAGAVILRWTPEDGWRGEYRLRVQAELVGEAGREKSADDSQDEAGNSPQSSWELRLGTSTGSIPFDEEATQLSLQVTEVVLRNDGPLWDGGPSLLGTLGDFEFPWSPEWGGDSRRNGVRGILLTRADQEVASGKRLTAWAAWVGWPRDSVAPLRHTPAQPGEDQRVWGGRWEIARAGGGQEWGLGERGVRLEAGGRGGTVVPVETSPVTTYYQESIAGLTAWDASGRWQWRGEVGLQHRRWAEDAEWDGFAWIQARQEWWGERRRKYEWVVDGYAVSSGFHPWAARRAKSNPLYEWRGEKGLRLQQVGWVNLGPWGLGWWKAEWQAVVGSKVQPVPDLASLSTPPQARAVNAPLNWRAGFVDCQTEWTGEVVKGWPVRLGAGWRTSTSPIASTNSNESAQDSNRFWSELRVEHPMQSQHGAVKAQWRPSYQLHWQSFSNESGEAEDETPVLDGATEGWHGDDAGDNRDELPVAIGLTHTAGLTTRWEIGQETLFTISGRVRCTSRSSPVWELSASVDSPNGWQWRFRWSWPDSATKKTDCYLLLRQYVPW
ncbi:MAG: hypothetical protein IMX01_01445 [Limnochordaceae bacterium]|nr:hypothetical protein [Limnochordaceae bacterium]